MIVKQVDFVDVKQSTICSGLYAGFKMSFALLNGLLNVKRSHHAVFRGRDGQVDKGCGAYV
jgi:hypothetical protein